MRKSYCLVVLVAVYHMTACGAAAPAWDPTLSNYPERLKKGQGNCLHNQSAQTVFTALAAGFSVGAGAAGFSTLGIEDDQLKVRRGLAAGALVSGIMAAGFQVAAFGMAKRWETKDCPETMRRVSEERDRDAKAFREQSGAQPNKSSLLQDSTLPPAPPPAEPRGEDQDLPSKLADVEPRRLELLPRRTLLSPL